MMYENWYETDLTKYKLTFGDRKLVQLLAITGDLYATSVIKKVGDGKEEIHWVLYLSRIFNGNLPDPDYGDKVKKMLEELGKEYGEEKIGITFHILCDGSVEKNSIGKVEFEEGGKVKTFPEQVKTWNQWTNIYAGNTYATEEEYKFMESLERLHPWKIKFFLPTVIDLPVHREDGDVVEKVLDENRKWVAAIYHTPKKLCSRVQGSSTYQPIHCVIGENVGEIIKFLEANPREYVTPISLYMYSPVNGLACIDTFLDTENVTGGLAPHHYTSQDLEEYRRNMRKEYAVALRFDHAKQPVILSPKNAKKKKEEK